MIGRTSPRRSLPDELAAQPYIALFLHQLGIRGTMKGAYCCPVYQYVTAAKADIEYAGQRQIPYPNPWCGHRG